MSTERQHSRGRAASEQGARGGAGQIDGQTAADDPAAAGAGGTVPSAGDAGDDKQVFARKGQFTGRAIPPQEGGPVGERAARDAAFEAAGAASPAPSVDEQHGVQPASAVPPPGGGVTGELGPIEAVARERDGYRADLQRLAADFDNFRKRAIRERESAAAAADAKLLGELLAVLDDFERALAHAGDAPAGSPQAQLADGIRMTHGRLHGVLAQHGLQEIPVGGEFDPHLHEAMMMQPAPAGVADGTVLQVVQKGYMLGERVLRHAKVIVAGEA